VLVGLVMVALAAGVVGLHVLVFRLLDDLIGVPFTLGVFALVYSATFVWIYREEIHLVVFRGRFARRMDTPSDGPVWPAPFRPAPIPLWSAEKVDEAAAHYANSRELALAQNAEMLRIARHALSYAVSENVGTQGQCRVLDESYGLITVGHSRPNEQLPYLYVHQYVEVTSGYPPVERTHHETLAHTWKIESDRYGKGQAVLTIGEDREPQLLLKPEFRWFAGTAAGWRQLTASLIGPE
jgi:hypothetical protein